MDSRNAPTFQKTIATPTTHPQMRTKYTRPTGSKVVRCTPRAPMNGVRVNVDARNIARME